MKIAIIGSGVAGLGAAWLMRDKADLFLFEKQERLGGHSHTVDLIEKASNQIIPVDTGFIVYNTRTYPNLINFFNALNIPTKPTDMSFAVSLNQGSREYSGDSLFSLFGHFNNLVNPSHWRMVRDLVRFYKNEDRLCSAAPGVSLGEFLAQDKYSETFCRDHILPMAAAIWSMSPDMVLDFPAANFGAFFKNHGLLELNSLRRPPWRTVTDGSKTYVDKAIKESRAKVQLNSNVVSIEGGREGATLIFLDGQRAQFDHVIIATHADEALGLLGKPSKIERDILGGFHYSSNLTYLHQDVALMPRRRQLWGSWNYLRSSQDKSDKVYVSYWMNRLQSLKSHLPILVTLNPSKPPAENKIHKKMVYHHPIFDNAALEAQKDIGLLQGHNRIWFAGSYCGYGFHEDAFSSAVAVAENLGQMRPWSVEDVSPAYKNTLRRS